MSARSEVAIVGVGTTKYARDARMGQEALAACAARDAIRDAGIARDEVVGICGSYQIPAYLMQSALGIAEISWYENPAFPPAAQFMVAANAILSGACHTILCYHAAYRFSGTSRSAAADPIRSRAGGGMNVPGATPETITSASAYAAWASRHFFEFGTTREDLGMIAINARTHAIANPHAVMRTPLSMDDYLSARMIRTPFGLYDMDLPVDGADAFVLTTPERAKDLKHRSVLIHASALGQCGPADQDQLPSLRRLGPDIVAERLWRSSDVPREAIDLVCPYDGFTIIPLVWLEALGYCARGEGGTLLRQSWNPARQRLEIGRALLNTHGGSLSEGGTQGVGLMREAVVQLRGEAGDRQIDNAKAAIVAPGGFVQVAAAMILRAG